MDEGPPPVLEESIFPNDPATPTTPEAAPSDVSDAPDISKKVDEDTTPTEAMVPMDNPAEGVTPEQNLEAEVKPKRVFNVRASHWYTTFGFEAMEYELPFNFVGEKNSFKTEQRKLYGGRIGFGREFYIGKGLMTSTRVEGYYMGTLFETSKTASPTIVDLKFASTKKSGQIYGVDAVQTLSYLWDFKTKNPFMDTTSVLTFEPFIEAGIGRANAYNQLDYNYKTSDVEEYDHSFTDEITSAKVGGGFNITSEKGYFCFFKVTQSRMEIADRRSKGYFLRDGVPRANVPSEVSKKLEPIMIYSLGGGYKF